MKELKKSIKAMQHFLSGLGSYHEALPLDSIRDALRFVGLDYQDGFVLCGRDGRCNIDLTYHGASIPNSLCFSWHRMETSGRYEVVAYIS